MNKKGNKKLSDQIYYIPNLLSFVRILLLIPVVYFLLTAYEEQNTLIIVLVLCMFFSDLLDGYIARNFNQVSEFGKIIDPLADKISVITLTLVLLYLGLIPLWFVIIVVARDLLILGFGLYLHKEKNIRIMSNFAGKAAVFLIGLIILFSIINSELLRAINNYLYYISIILILYSLYLYFTRFKKLIGG